MDDPEAEAFVEDAQKTEAEDILTPPETVETVNPSNVAQEPILGPPIFLICNDINLALQQACLDFVRESDQVERLNVFVCSYGGNPDVAFNSVNILREKCKYLVAYVPDYAKSAATLFCLGADEIVMNLGAQLGPLDMQVRDPRNSPEDISALSGYQALEAVANFLHNEIDVTSLQLYRKARTNISDSLSYAMKLVDSMAKPLFGQVNPYDLGLFVNALAVSEKYGSELLTRYGNRTKKQTDSIVNTLVKEYPSHSFVIDLTESKKIGLSARAPNTEEARIMNNGYSFLLRNQSLQKHGIITELEGFQNGSE